jgi:serine/threonine-protein kinase
MSGTRIPRGLFFAVVLAAIAQSVHDFPLLPDRLASHFAASGIPNGWMTKSQFFIAYALMLVPAHVVEFWVSHRIANKSDARLNLPNKEYWPAPDHRAETFAYFDSFFAWYGCAFLFVEVFAMGLAMRANFDTPPQLPTGPIVSVIAGFVLYNVAAVIAVLRRFSMPR